MNNRFFILVAFLFCSFVLQAQKYYLFIGSYNTGKDAEGIYVYQFDPNTGDLKKLSSFKIFNPSYLTVSSSGKFLYACTETKTPNAGSVSAFKVDSRKGVLEFINSQRTGGENPVYLSATKNGKWLANANYTEGSVSAYQLRSDGGIEPPAQTIHYTDSSINKQRQDKSHVHSSIFSPSDDHLFLPDLGADKIRCYSFSQSASQPLQPTQQGFMQMTPGSGPRHFCFHPNAKFAYCIEEMSGFISAFSYKNGRLDNIQRIAAHTDEYKENFSGADIHISPDGRFLYASNRGKENNIAIFSIEQSTGKLVSIGYQSVLGNHPRNFVIDPTGKFLIVANQISNNVVVFKRDLKTGMLINTGKQITIPEPSCLKIQRYN